MTSLPHLSFLQIELTKKYIFFQPSSILTSPYHITMKSFALLALLVAGVTSSAIRLGSYDSPSLIRSSDYGYGSGLVRSFIPITRFENEIRGSLYNGLTYSTGNGINVDEHTRVVSGGGGAYEDEYGQLVRSDSSISKTGSFSYTSPEGIPIHLNYVADANGFRAEGAHLPRPVQMPAEHAEAHRLALARVAPVSSYGESYNSPALAVRSSYNAPAPAVVRVQSYDAPAPVLRSSYSAPALIRSSY